MRDYNYRKNWNDLLTPEIVKKLALSFALVLSESSRS